MRFKKTEKAKWTIVYHEGKRIAEFVNKEFETDDKDVIRVLKSMGYQDIGKLGNTVESNIGSDSGPSVNDLLGDNSKGPVPESPESKKRKSGRSSVSSTTNDSFEAKETIRRKPGRPPVNRPISDNSAMV